jgi:TRAP transporter 4TM/12TM fusion protein
MKKVGYKPHQAAAIEATASTGGQIMPPVMGATAFIMSGVTGLPYIDICVAAAVPAFLYYLSAGLYTHFQAGKLNVSYIEEDVDIRELWLTAPLFLLPLISLVSLMVVGYTPVYAVTWSLFLLVALSLVRKKTRPSLKQWVDGIKKGAVTGAEIGVSCGLVGAIVATSSMTGLVIKLPAAIEAWSGGVLLYGLVITACVSIILGCGVTIAATYILVAMMAAPALMSMGLTTMQAHLFAFYFAVISFVTPPVALGALFASRIANSGFFFTAVEAAKVALAGFIVPFFIILCPALIFEAPFTFSVVLQFISVALIITVLQIVVCNYYLTTISFLQRILFFITAIIFLIFMAKKIYVWFALGAVLFIVLTIAQKRRTQPG